MKNTIIIVATLLTIFASCGPSKAELEAREHFKNDSTVNAAKQQLLDEQAAAAKQEALKQQLMELKGQLAAAEVALEDIEKFKLLRSAGEKAQQVAAQTVYIEQLKNQIAETEKQIEL